MENESWGGGSERKNLLLNRNLINQCQSGEGVHVLYTSRLSYSYVHGKRPPRQMGVVKVIIICSKKILFEPNVARKWKNSARDLRLKVS